MSESKKSKSVSCPLEVALEILQNSDTTSLLKRFFTREIIKKLKMRTTCHGGMLIDCIDAGIENLHSIIGIEAADPKCYEAFADLFNPIIEAYHQIERTTMHPGPGTHWGIVDNFKDLDPEGKYVVGTRVKCCRNLKGYPFRYFMSSAHEAKIEDKLLLALCQLSGEMRVYYRSLLGMSQYAQRNFIAQYYYNDSVRAFDDSPTIFWPSGRCIFLNRKQNFSVWVCEDDHVTIMSMQKDGNISEVLKRLIRGSEHLERCLKFTTNERFGYLSQCPSNLGHATRAYISMKLPRLAADMPKLQELAAKYDMQVTKVANNFEGLHELSNARVLGSTEYHCMKKLCVGIAAIIKAESEAPEVATIFCRGSASRSADF